MVQRILRFPVGRWIDPADAFAAVFADAAYAVWLDAGNDATTGMSYLASGTPGAAFATERVVDGRVTVTRCETDEPPVLFDGSMLDWLASQEMPTHSAPALDHPRFGLGWVGWIGYESGASACGIPVSETSEPDAAMLFVDRAVAFDHDRREVELIVLDDDPLHGEGPRGAGESAAGESAVEWAERMRGLLTAESVTGAAARQLARAAPTRPPATVTWRHDDSAYLALIARCQHAIGRGDAYQLCLTNQASATVHVEPLDTYLRLRDASPTHHGGLLAFGPVALLSATPEQFVSITGDGRISTRPIKGTRPRGATIARDLELRAELEASDKERAENVMIVDLMRNDLGRVCELGTVEVRHLLAVESYAQVHQLVSTIEGRLASGVTRAQAIAACFPAGSMTGAPKLSAMRILHELEAGPRGVYAGCFGYVGLDGCVDLAMVIRSIVVTPDEVTIGAGGGITALSIPSEELDEVRLKAAVLFSAAVLAGETPPTMATVV